jgi:outer membrane immunogenic protein
MKNFIFVSVAVFALFVCGPAGAADIAGGSYNWTGFYAGLNVGAAINNSKYTGTPSSGLAPLSPFISDSAGLNSTGVTGGAQLGYNFQSGCFVYGLETDFNGNSTSESTTVTNPLLVPLTHAITQNFDFFGTLRGRLGYTPVDRLLVYATGGLAYGNVSSSSTVTVIGLPLYGSASDFQAGWTVGGGAEYALTKCLTVRLEYLYVDLGSMNYTCTTPLTSVLSYSTQLDTTEHVIRMGVNYKF